MPITIDLTNDPYFKEGLQEGLKKGIEKGKKEVLKKSIKILKEFLSDEEIAKKLNISLEEVKSLKG